MTDVYILPDHQGKGLAKWLIGCVNEILGQWEGLKRVMLINSADGVLYREGLRMRPWEENENAGGGKVWSTGAPKVQGEE